MLKAKMMDIYTTVSGWTLAATPVWSKWITYINDVAGMIAAVCGAILGLWGVWRLLKKRN